MLNTQNEHILSMMQDYKIHLIEPANIPDEDFDKFRTDLGAVLQYIKYSNDRDKLDEIVHKESRFREMNPDSGKLINAVTGSRLKFEVDKEGKIDMCTAIDEMRKESREEGRAEERVNTEREKARADSAEAQIRQLKEELAALKAKKTME